MMIQFFLFTQKHKYNMQIFHFVIWGLVLDLFPGQVGWFHVRHCKKRKTIG